jgi:hypothetical protein
VSGLTHPPTALMVAASYVPLVEDLSILLADLDVFVRYT